jgi:hypothetical protein
MSWGLIVLFNVAFRFLTFALGKLFYANAGLADISFALNSLNVIRFLCV